MIIAKSIHVRCVNENCERPADASVQLEQVAPLVVATPRLTCLTCEHELKVVDE